MTDRVIVGHGLTPSGWVEAAVVLAPADDKLFSACVRVSHLLHESGFSGAEVSVRAARPGEVRYLQALGEVQGVAV